jgi:hypothetical protein
VSLGDELDEQQKRFRRYELYRLYTIAPFAHTGTRGSISARFDFAFVLATATS